MRGYPLEEGGSRPLLPLLPGKRKTETQTERVQHGPLSIQVRIIAHFLFTLKRSKSATAEAAGSLQSDPFSLPDVEHALVAGARAHVDNRGQPGLGSGLPQWKLTLAVGCAPVL